MTNEQQTTVSVPTGTGIGFREEDIEGTFLGMMYDELVCHSDEYSDGIAVFENSDCGFSFCLTLGGKINYRTISTQPYSEDLVKELEASASKISTIIELAIN